MDSVISGGPAEADAFVPTARAVTKAARDALVSFDPDLHLPKGLRDRFGASLGKLAQRAGKSLGTASRTLGQVEEMLRLYQPFVYDHDPRLVTERVRTLSAQLDEDERADFGWDTDSLDWRDYWMNVQIPGLDRWSLPVLRGERVPEDEPQPLHVGVREIGDALPSSRDSMMPPAEAESMEASMEEGAE
jgi:hypothetical protein